MKRDRYDRSRVLWTGNTVRQEVVNFASVRRDFAPGDAIEDVCDGWERCPVNSINHQMGLYVRDLSDAAWKRLVRDVEKARRG
jgi:hypothetical protein